MPTIAAVRFRKCVPPQPCPFGGRAPRPHDRAAGVSAPALPLQHDAAGEGGLGAGWLCRAVDTTEINCRLCPLPSFPQNAAVLPQPVPCDAGGVQHSVRPAPVSSRTWRMAVRCTAFSGKVPATHFAHLAIWFVVHLSHQTRRGRRISLRLRQPALSCDELRMHIAGADRHFTGIKPMPGSGGSKSTHALSGSCRRLSRRS